MFLLVLFVALSVIVAAPGLLSISHRLAAHLSEIQPEQQRLVATGLGAVLLMGVYTLGQSLYPGWILPQGSLLCFNILVAGIWALMVLPRHRSR
jgi:hypothetical protein